MTATLLDLRPTAAARPAVTIGSGAEVPATLIVSPLAAPNALEQYRKLAAALHLVQSERRIKVLALVSAAPGDGKTLTAANLALTFAESYRKRVLLVDADLRRPSVHAALAIPNGVGLADELRLPSPKARPDFPEHLVVMVLPRLAVITGGEPNPDPTGDLASDRMQTLIHQAAERYDWVIVDTPPIGVMSDGRLLTAIADGVLFVIKAESTPYPLALRAIDTIGRSRILGVVMNAVGGHIETAGYNYRAYYDRYTSQSCPKY